MHRECRGRLSSRPDLRDDDLATRRRRVERDRLDVVLEVVAGLLRALTRSSPEVQDAERGRAIRHEPDQVRQVEVGLGKLIGGDQTATLLRSSGPDRGAVKAGGADVNGVYLSHETAFINVLRNPCTIPEIDGQELELAVAQLVKGEADVPIGTVWDGVVVRRSRRTGGGVSELVELEVVV